VIADSASSNLIEDFSSIKKNVMRILNPIKPADSSTAAAEDFYDKVRRTHLNELLPEYYLIYFLLVDLMDFEDTGRSEKVDWSIPVDFHGEAYLIEHQKFGVGIFVYDLKEQEEKARTIAIKLKKAVKAAKPYFDWKAKIAISESKVNLVNRAFLLFSRYEFFLAEYKRKEIEAEENKGKFIDRVHIKSNGEEITYKADAYYSLRRESSWLALSAIESFFSWTEHVLVSICLLMNIIQTANEVAKMMNLNWKSMFAKAIDISNPQAKRYYDSLGRMREEIRNYFTHGAFGKEYQAFSFHSTAGAVPVLLPHKATSMKYSLGVNGDFDHEKALKEIEDFIGFLWSGDREPAYIYIMNSGLPIILTDVINGTYMRVMKSPKMMQDYVMMLSYHFDREANMDY